MSGIKPGTVFCIYCEKTECIFRTKCHSVLQFVELSYSQGKHKGVLHMNPRQRMLAIKLTEKLAKNPEYARTIGVEITNTKKEAESDENRN